MGNFKDDKYEGEGSLVWPDGFTIKTEWKNDRPLSRSVGFLIDIVDEYREQVVHPSVLQRVEKGMCTSTEELKGKQAPQMMWKCCKKLFCRTCWKHHSESTGHEGKWKWEAAWWCDCKEEACKTEVEETH